MKQYSEKEIKYSEIMQLIILHMLYSLKESKDVFFQGGTAIRWCWNGARFSEDLDFVSPLDKKRIGYLIERISEPVKKNIIAHFGIGDFEVREKKTTRSTSYVSFFQFSPLKERKKISVKVEFEILKEDFSPETEKMILSILPFVRHLITVGEFRIPSPNSIILVETMEEILSDKIRALLERDYLKGRDFYDIWFLTSLGVRCLPDLFKRKTIMYKAPFILKREMEFFLNPGFNEKKEIIEAIKQDLSRFLSPREMSMFENNRFNDFFNALRVVFVPLKESGILLSKETK